jgi:hypothetical protein
LAPNIVASFFLQLLQRFLKGYMRFPQVFFIENCKLIVASIVSYRDISGDNFVIFCAAAHALEKTMEQ